VSITIEEWDAQVRETWVALNAYARRHGAHSELSALAHYVAHTLCTYKHPRRSASAPKLKDVFMQMMALAESIDQDPTLASEADACCTAQGESA